MSLTLPYWEHSSVVLGVCLRRIGNTVQSYWELGSTTKKGSGTQVPLVFNKLDDSISKL